MTGDNCDWVLVRDLHVILESGYNNHVEFVTVHGSRELPLELIEQVLRDIEVRVAPILEPRGVDIGDLTISLRRIYYYPLVLPAYVCAMEMYCEVVDVFGESTLGDLRKAYEDALNRGDTVFTVESVEFYTGYVKYLFKFLEAQGVKDDALLRGLIESTE